MKLIDKIKKNTIILPFDSYNQKISIQKLLNHLLSEGYLTSTAKLFSSLENQDETIGSAVGRGIAYHHSISGEITEMVAILGISKSGIDYKSPDKQKVHFTLLILDSINEPNYHRKFIKRFQKFINDFNMKTKILDCESNDEVFKMIEDWENKYLLNESI
jgi:PTS system nitrogen regulatory IIA component